MKNLSPKTRRNGKIIVSNRSNSEPNPLQSRTNNKMEDTKTVTNEQRQVRSPWPLITD